MQSLAEKVMKHAVGLPEGTPLAAKELLHLGTRAAVDQVLSRLVQRGALFRREFGGILSEGRRAHIARTDNAGGRPGGGANDIASREFHDVLLL